MFNMRIAEALFSLIKSFQTKKPLKPQSPSSEYEHIEHWNPTPNSYIEEFMQMKVSSKAVKE